MIQRIQSVYILLSVIMLIVVLFLPLADFNAVSGEIYQLNASEIINISKNEVMLKTIPLIILISINLLISVITLFMYKNRKLQMRMSIYNIILMIGLFGLIFYFYKAGMNEVAGNKGINIISEHMRFTSLAPVLASFFTYLAYKKILKDDILIKSIDRIR